MSNDNSQPEWGHPAIDSSKCTACGLCADICPTGTIRMKDGKPAVTAEGKMGCLACGHCACVCPSGAATVTGRGMKADDVFRLAPLSERAAPGALAALMQARRSVRRYADRPLEKEKIDRLLEMAATAPMGFPPSPVGIVAVNGRDRVKELTGDLAPAIKKFLFFRTPAGKLLMPLIMEKPMRAIMRDYVLPVAKEIAQAWESGKDLLFYDAPCVLLFHYPMKDPVDPAIACSFASIAAEALGLGSCMIGTVAPAMQNSRALMSKWRIPEGRRVTLALTLGYPAVKFANGVRRRFSSVAYS